MFQCFGKKGKKTIPEDGHVVQGNQHQHEVNIQSSKTNVSSLGSAYVPSDNKIVSRDKKDIYLSFYS